MRNFRTFHFVDASAGSGKTHTAIRWALMEAAVQRRKFVFVFKSIDLLLQAQADAIAHQQCKNTKVPVTAIHSNQVGRNGSDHSVGTVIREHLDRAHGGQPELLMITEVAFINLQHWPKRYLWSIVCDEIPDIAPAHKLNIPDNHALLTDHLKLGGDSGGYSEVVPTKAGRAALVGYAENRSRDEISKLLTPLAKQIMSPYFRTYVKTQQYMNVVAQSGDARTRQIEMFSLLQPTLFGSGRIRSFNLKEGRADQVEDSFAGVILMGAAFNESLLGIVWPAMNVKFKPKAEIHQGLRYHAHDCGPRLRFEYLFEADWSKSFAGKSSEYRQKQMPNFSILLQCIAQRFQGQQFVYLTNKDTEWQVNALLAPLDGEQLPNAPWGLNCYQHVHNAAILSALNPTPAHLKFLESLKLSSFAVRNAMFHSQIYQAIMRTSLRDLQSTAPVRVLLPDLKSAMAVSQKFPGSKISRFTDEIEEHQPKPRGRPRKAAIVPTEMLTT